MRKLCIFLSRQQDGVQNHNLKISIVVCFFGGVIPRRLIYICRRFGTLYHTDRVFWNVGIYKSEAGESPKRKQTTFWTRRKLEIKNTYFLSHKWHSRKMCLQHFRFFRQYRSIFRRWMANPFECILRNPHWVNVLKISLETKGHREKSRRSYIRFRFERLLTRRTAIVKSINLSKLILRSSNLKDQTTFV